MTVWTEADLIRHLEVGRCPDCYAGGSLMPGPRGGLSRNWTCGLCRNRFNVTRFRGRVIFAQRLPFADKPPSFVCWRCGAESFNPRDIANRYCGACHAFADDP